MSVDIIQSHRPIWVCKLSNDKLRRYLDAINEFELKGTTDNELLIDTAETWYNNSIQRLANDIYKEAAIRWYEAKEKQSYKRELKNAPKSRADKKYQREIDSMFNDLFDNR